RPQLLHGRLPEDLPMTLASERARVAQHILSAESGARARAVTDLDPLRQLVRELLLDELAHYRSDGRFPINREHTGPIPSFVDASGTRCALAHLLELGGEAELVQRIAHERNHA